MQHLPFLCNFPFISFLLSFFLSSFFFKKKLILSGFLSVFQNSLFFFPVFLDSLDFKEGIGLQIPKLPLLKLNKKLN